MCERVFCVQRRRHLTIYLPPAITARSDGLPPRKVMKSSASEGAFGPRLSGELAGPPRGCRQPRVRIRPETPLATTFFKSHFMVKFTDPFEGKGANWAEMKGYSYFGIIDGTNVDRVKRPLGGKWSLTLEEAAGLRLTLRTIAARDSYSRRISIILSRKVGANSLQAADHRPLSVERSMVWHRDPFGIFC
jgi:hypothetical protein